ncbi:MAG: DUF5916 domain-containing protein [bacterium]
MSPTPNCRPGIPAAAAGALPLPLLLLLGSAPAGANPSFAAWPIPAGAALPVVDGRLDDAVWSLAPAITDFRERSPREGAAPSESTSVRLAYTATDLYVAVRCEDSHPEGIVSTTRRRDDFSLTEDDQFAVAIDSYADRHDGFFFSTNPLGVRVDAQFFDEGDVFADGWDGEWDVRACRDSLGWSAELRIPFSTLRFRRAERDTMGVNLFRRLIRTNEELFSPLIPLSRAAGTPSVSLARQVVFQGIVPGRGVWVQPYVAARGSAAGASSRDASLDSGLDARWTPAGTLAANLSVNTDFAQVEADDREINLTRFALFVPEKRDFFLENAGLFAFGAPSEAEIFFSRRVGLQGGGASEAAAVPIRVGAKASGRAGRTEAGALYVRTGEARGAPGEDFVVARVKRRLDERSWVGAVVTRRDGSPSAAGSALGADGLVRLPGEIDVSTFLAASAREGDAFARRSAASRLRVERGGERMGLHLEILDLGADFSPPIGFLARPAVRCYRAGFSLPRYADSGALRRVTPEYAFERFEGRSGRLQDDGHRVALGFDVRSGDALSVFVERTRERVASAFPLPGGIAIPAGSYRALRAGVGVRTKAGRPLSASVAADGGGFHGGTRATLTASLVGKARGRLRAGPEIERSWIRVEGGRARPLVLRLRTELDLDVSASVTSFVQYDNESGELGWRAQLRVLRREGAELLCVYGLGVHPDEEAPDGAPRQWFELKATYRVDL